MDLAFPLNVDEWRWDTIESISNISEGQFIEYKSNLHARDRGQKDQWQAELEREITAFASSTGGVIVFGVTDGGDPSPFEPPEHEIRQSVTRLIQNITLRNCIWKLKRAAVRQKLFWRSIYHDQLEYDRFGLGSRL